MFRLLLASLAPQSLPSPAPTALATPAVEHPAPLPVAPGCLPPPDPDGIDGPVFDDAVVLSGGLSSGQVEDSLDPVSSRASRCLPSDHDLLAELTTRLEVACDGSVTRVVVLDDGGIDPRVVSCVTEKLAGAEFPPHALREGFTFDYRMDLWAWTGKEQASSRR